MIYALFLSPMIGSTANMKKFAKAYDIMCATQRAKMALSAKAASFTRIWPLSYIAFAFLFTPTTKALIKLSKNGESNQVADRLLQEPTG